MYILAQVNMGVPHGVNLDGEGRFHFHADRAVARPCGASVSGDH